MISSVADACSTPVTNEQGDPEVQAVPLPPVETYRSSASAGAAQRQDRQAAGDPAEPEGGGEGKGGDIGVTGVQTCALPIYVHHRLGRGVVARRDDDLVGGRRLLDAGDERAGRPGGAGGAAAAGRDVPLVGERRGGPEAGQAGGRRRGRTGGGRGGEGGRYWRDWSSDVCSSDLRSSPSRTRSSCPTRR